MNIVIYKNLYDYSKLTDIIIDSKKYNNDEIKTFVNDNFKFNIKCGCHIDNNYLIYIDTQHNNITNFLDFCQNEKVIFYHYIEYRNKELYLGSEKILVTNYGRVLSVLVKEKGKRYYYKNCELKAILPSDNLLFEYNFWIPLDYITLLNSIMNESLFITMIDTKYPSFSLTDKICNILSSIQNIIITKQTVPELTENIIKENLLLKNKIMTYQEKNQLEIEKRKLKIINLQMEIDSMSFDN